MKISNEIREGGAVALLIVSLLIFGYGVSWILTCGVIKLITLCFGVAFKWSVATGIWLVLCILRGVFRVTAKND